MATFERWHGAPPRGLSAERIPADVRTQGGYRERERRLAPGIRLTYRPPRLEWLWVVTLLLLGVAGMIAFIAWLGASSGVMVYDPHDVPFFGTLGAIMLAFVLFPIVRGLWPAPRQVVWLDHVDLRTASGNRWPTDVLSGFGSEEVPPRRTDALAPSTWRVLVGVPDGRSTVADGLPTEDHARWIASRLDEVCAELRRR